MSFPERLAGAANTDWATGVDGEKKRSEHYQGTTFSNECEWVYELVLQ